MLMLPHGIKVFVATKPLDMRSSFDGMVKLVQSNMNVDPFSGHLFLFCNKRGDKVKILYWDRNGFCQWYKRLERGIFRLPRVSGKSFTLNPSELGLLLEGIDLTDKDRFRETGFRIAN